MKQIIIATGLLVSLCMPPLVVAETAPVTEPERMSDESARDLLKTVVQQAVFPVYERLDKSSVALADSTEAFCAKPAEDGLHNVRSRWAGVLSAWEQSSGLFFGPAVEDEIDFTVYFRPVKKAVVKGLFKGEGAIDVATVDSAGVGGQGLATLEYLLFDRELSDEVILSGFADPVQKRCDYLVAAAELLKTNLQTIARGWVTEGGNYGEAVWTAGMGSAYFTEAYQPVELLVNRLYQSVQAVEIKKLGGPLGVKTSRDEVSKAYPYKLEAWRSGHSLANINDTLKGLRFVLGDGGVLAWLKENNQAELAEKLDQQLQALLSEQWPSGDLFMLLENQPESVKPFFVKVHLLSDTMRKELVPALGVQLGFNQNDGD